MDEITLKLNAAQFQVVWGALMEMPAKLVFPVLQAIQTQVKEQETPRANSQE